MRFQGAPVVSLQQAFVSFDNARLMLPQRDWPFVSGFVVVCR